MNKIINFHNRKCFLVLVICLISSSSVFALNEKNQQVVTQNLSRKLQSDLGNKNVRVKLNNIAERRISRSEVSLTGRAVCVLTEENQQLPIQFEAKVNPVNQNVLEIKYDFVEVVASASDIAPSANEEVLMKELMGKIRQDFNTENIVIAIDNVEAIGRIGNGNKFLGVGEVRIGDMVWSKIKFDVVLDAQTQKAEKIIYKVEK